LALGSKLTIKRSTEEAETAPQIKTEEPRVKKDRSYVKKIEPGSASRRAVANLPDVEL